MLTLIHAADFHLDSPFAGLTPAKAAARRAMQRQLPGELAQLAREVGAQAALLPGDLLDGQRAYGETAEALAQGLGEFPCPVFVAPGNHDCYDARSFYRTVEWPGNVHIFTKSAPEAVELDDIPCTVHGAAFTAPHRTDSPLAGFHAPRDGRIHLMAVHGDVGGRGDYGPITREEIAGSGLTYLALGHVHSWSGPCRDGDTVWCYPGCPQGRGFDETGDKGAVVVRIQDGGEVSLTFVPMARSRYQVRQVDLTGADDLLGAARAALDCPEDVYRLIFTGERGSEGLRLHDLQQALSSRCQGLELVDRTRLRRSVWQRAGEDSLTGLFLREMERRCQEEPDNEVLQQAVRFGLAALENREDIAP